MNEELEAQFMIHAYNDSVLYRKLLTETKGIIPPKDSQLYIQYQYFWDTLYDDSKLEEEKL